MTQLALLPVAVAPARTYPAGSRIVAWWCSEGWRAYLAVPGAPASATRTLRARENAPVRIVTTAARWAFGCECPVTVHTRGMWTEGEML